MAFRGLARIPRPIARRLSEAAHACGAAAAGIEAIARSGGDVLDTMRAAAEAERTSHDAALASAHMLGGGIDREDVVGIARSLQTLAGRLEEAAFALGRLDRPSAPWDALTGVVRDAAREAAAAIDRLDGPVIERDAHLDRADELHDEWRRICRRARAQTLAGAADLNAALTADMALSRLEEAATACRRAARTVRTVAIKHA